MDPLAILNLVAKAVGVVEILIQAGRDAMPAIVALKNLVTGAQKGTLTEAEISQTEALLDDMIAEFNTDLPPG